MRSSLYPFSLSANTFNSSCATWKITPLQVAPRSGKAPKYVGPQLTVSTRSYQPRVMPLTETGKHLPAFGQVSSRDSF